MNHSALTPLAAALRRYSYGYTAAHDFSMARQILSADYELTMGATVLVGRDGQYIPAVEQQLSRYPGLGFTVHDLVLGKDRAALHFTEHGRSVRGLAATWTGIALYDWDGAWLTRCRVEQDYRSQRRQERFGTPNAVPAPAIDPFSQPAADPDPGAEASVRQWLTGGGIEAMPVGSVDDEYCTHMDRVVLADQQTTILDIFTAGSRAAFHVRTDGYVAGAPAEFRPHLGKPASLYVTGIAVSEAGVVHGVRAVTDRLAAYRRLLGSEPPS